MTDQFLSISIEGYYSLKYQITGLDGKLVKEGDVLNALTILDLSDLSNGTYVLRIYNGHYSVEQKIVKISK